MTQIVHSCLVCIIYIFVTNISTVDLDLKSRWNALARDKPTRNTFNAKYSNHTVIAPEIISDPSL